MSKRHAILSMINEERSCQDQQWGGPEHDEKLTTDEWLNAIYKQMCLIDEAEDEGEVISRFIKIAAIAVACIEAKT